MNNREKAIQVIRRQTLISDLATAKDVTRRLDQAGLITPNLPKPNEEGRFIVGQRAIWAGYSGVLCIELRGLGGYAATDGAAVPIGEADEAREVAHALLAAANYSEGNQK